MRDPAKDNRRQADSTSLLKTGSNQLGQLFFKTILLLIGIVKILELLQGAVFNGKIGFAFLFHCKLFWTMVQSRV